MGAKRLGSEEDVGGGDKREASTKRSLKWMSSSKESRQNGKRKRNTKI